MTVYTAIYAIFASLGIAVRRKQEALFLALALLFLLFFMGTRYEVGCDFGGYLNRFENIHPYASLGEAFGKQEIAFSFLEIATRTSGLGFVSLIFSSTLIILICYWVFLRQIHNSLLVLALLFPIMMMQLGMSGLRQGIAVGFLLVAATTFMKRQRLMTALWIIIGTQFHLSAAVFLPLAFLAGRDVSLKQMIAAGLLLSPLALLLVGDRIGVYQDRYVDEIYGDQSSAGAVFRYALNIVPAALFLYFRKTVEGHFPKEYQLLLIFAIATVALAPLTVLSTFALHRLNFYVMPFTIMMAVYLIYCIPSTRDRSLALLIPIGAYGGYSVLWQLTSLHFEYCYSNYQSYLAL